MEDVVGGAGAIGPRVAPVEVVVIDKSPVEDDSAVWLQRAGERVGGVSWRAAIARWAKLTFGVGFDSEACEVRDESIDSVDFLMPPGFDARIEWVEGVKFVDCLGAGDVDGERHAHAPGAEGVGDTGEFFE